MSRSWCITTKHQSSLFLLSLNSVRRSSSKYSYAFPCCDTWLTMCLFRLFFERRHNICPENRGEKRECLIILEHVGLNDGLLDKLATDAEVSTGLQPSAISCTGPTLGLSMHLTHFLFLFRLELSVTSKISIAERNCIIKSFFEYY